MFEALKSGRPVNKVYILNSDSDKKLRAIEAMAKNGGIPVIRADKAWFNRMLPGSHQGTAAVTSAKEYCDVGDIMDCAAERAEAPLIVVANKILDPHNLGAIIRSAEAAGAHGVVIPKRNAAGLTDSAAKASAGAIEYMRVARVPNIHMALRELKKRGVWIVGADANGDIPYTECDMTGPSAIVIGGENESLGKLVGDVCDCIVRLPMRGKIASLNASASAAVLLYETLRQRGVERPVAAEARTQNPIINRSTGITADKTYV